MVVLDSIEDQVSTAITTYAIRWYIYRHTFRSEFNYGTEDSMVVVEDDYFIADREGHI
jgi:hypothetical protein